MRNKQSLPIRSTQGKFSSNTPLPPFERALKYLSISPRSIQEIHDYLVKKRYEETDINAAIRRLIDLKFLNDDNFARGFAESRQRKGKSKRAIEFELKLKGVNKAISEEVMEFAKSDFKTALEYITKRMRQFARYEPEERQRKIVSRLRSRGFSWETISKVLRKI